MSPLNSNQADGFWADSDDGDAFLCEISLDSFKACLDSRRTDLAIKMIQSGLISKITIPELVEVLSYSIGRRSMLLVQELLQQGIPIEMNQSNGLSLIEQSILDLGRWEGEENLSDDLAILRLLIRHGANVNFRDGKGRTPLLFAAEVNPDAIEVLLQSGADVNARDCEGNNVLFTYLDQYELCGNVSDKFIALLDLLIEYGLDLCFRNQNGDTFLHEILCNEVTWAEKVIPKIVAADANSINLRNISGHTPLVYAVASRDFESVYELLKAGANPDQLCVDEECTLIEEAAEFEDPGIYGLLKHFSMKRERL